MGAEIRTYGNTRHKKQQVFVVDALIIVVHRVPSTSVRNVLRRILSKTLDSSNGSLSPFIKCHTENKANIDEKMKEAPSRKGSGEINGCTTDTTMETQICIFMEWFSAE